MIQLLIVTKDNWELHIKVSRAAFISTPAQIAPSFMEWKLASLLRSVGETVFEPHVAEEPSWRFLWLAIIPPVNLWDHNRQIHDQILF